MIGADSLCETLLANDVDVCFANPGTSEMHFVAALDRQPGMRCVLGLFEGVVTAAADGYARMSDKPAATLLHLGPGLANGLANLHNARRARTPMINIVGDHASHHLPLDAPLTSDIDTLARPMSQWVGRARNAASVSEDTAAAYVAAMTLPGVATLILPADAAWDDVAPHRPGPARLPAPAAPDVELIRDTARAIRAGGRTMLLLSGKALRADALAVAGSIAVAAGLRIMAQQSNARIERGAGRMPIEKVPYPVDMALDKLKDVDRLVLVGAREPVAFFGYPGKPGRLLPKGCEVIDLAGRGSDLLATLHALADELGVRPRQPSTLKSHRVIDESLPSGALTDDAVAVAVAKLMPENAIICDEAITSATRFFALSQNSAPHDYLQLTGGAIGIGIPMAAGAAIACPGRQVIALQADGSGMFTVQGLWTHARENLDVITVVFSNRAYSILVDEMRNVGVERLGHNARRMLNLEEPEIDWVRMAGAMGVEGGRATTVEEFVHLFRRALARSGPFLIEAMV